MKLNKAASMSHWIWGDAEPSIKEPELDLRSAEREKISDMVYTGPLLYELWRLAGARGCRGRRSYHSLDSVA